MTYMQAVLKATAYMEAHLTDPLTVEAVATEAGYSPYHFQRIFQAVTRSAVSEYIRTRRLTCAAIEETYRYIYSVWLPQSGFVRLDGPEFARNDHRYAGPDDEHSEFDIYIPVSADVGMT